MASESKSGWSEEAKAGRGTMGSKREVQKIQDEEGSFRTKNDIKGEEDRGKIFLSPADGSWGVRRKERNLQDASGKRGNDKILCRKKRQLADNSSSDGKKNSKHVKTRRSADESRKGKV